MPVNPAGTMLLHRVTLSTVLNTSVASQSPVDATALSMMSGYTSIPSHDESLSVDVDVDKTVSRIKFIHLYEVLELSQLYYYLKCNDKFTIFYIVCKMHIKLPLHVRKRNLSPASQSSFSAPVFFRPRPPFSLIQIFTFPVQ